MIAWTFDGQLVSYKKKKKNGKQKHFDLRRRVGFENWKICLVRQVIGFLV